MLICQVLLQISFKWSSLLKFSSSSFFFFFCCSNWVIYIILYHLIYFWLSKVDFLNCIYCILCLSLFFFKYIFSNSLPKVSLCSIIILANSVTVFIIFSLRSLSVKFRITISLGIWVGVEIILFFYLKHFPLSSYFVWPSVFASVN